MEKDRAALSGTVTIAAKEKGGAQVLLDHFDFVSIVNLRERVDQKTTCSAISAASAIIPARVRSNSSGFPGHVEGWTSAGARGCFLSHYEILKQARDRGVRTFS